LAGRFGGRILPDFGQKWQKRGRRKFKFAEFGHLLDAALCFKLKQPPPRPPLPPTSKGTTEAVRHEREISNAGR
jgi:hypothetical protein